MGHSWGTRKVRPRGTCGTLMPTGASGGRHGYDRTAYLEGMAAGVTASSSGFAVFRDRAGRASARPETALRGIVPPERERRDRFGSALPTGFPGETAPAHEFQRAERAGERVAGYRARRQRYRRGGGAGGWRRGPPDPRPGRRAQARCRSPRAGMGRSRGRWGCDGLLGEHGEVDEEENGGTGAMARHGEPSFSGPRLRGAGDSTRKSAARGQPVDRSALPSASAA